MWISKGGDGRVQAVVYKEAYADETYVEVDEPEGFGDPAEWVYRDGQLVHEPPEPTDEQRAEAEEAERQRQLGIATQMMLRASAAAMTDAQLLTVPLLFEEYEVGRAYAAGDVFRHDGGLFRVAQDHTSQAQWVPGEPGTESLYTRITVDPETGYGIWQQPTGAHDAYDTGDRVLYPDASGRVYESTIDGNVWSPDAYPQGWKEVSE